MAGIDLPVPGNLPKPFQRGRQLGPVSRGEICAAYGALHEGIPAKEDFLSHIAAAPRCVPRRVETRYLRVKWSPRPAAASLPPLRKAHPHHSRKIQIGVCEERFLVLMEIHRRPCSFLHLDCTGNMVKMAVGQPNGPDVFSLQSRFQLKIPKAGIHHRRLAGGRICDQIAVGLEHPAAKFSVP